MLQKRSPIDLFHILIGILLFIFAIELLKGSAGALAPELKNFMSFVTNPFNALGFGWLASYIMLSGYPVTVFSLTLLDSGVIGEFTTFFMINGSRLGASLIIILIGVVESLKNKELDIVDSSSLGFLTLLITYTIVVPAIVIGNFFVNYRLFDFPFDLNFISVISMAYDPLVQPVLNFSGPLVGLIGALLTLYLALTIFEKPFHKIKIENFKSSWVNFLMERTSYSFLFGALITFFSQSVALSIGLIVPLYNRGFLQRRNMIPYIMGACITTFGGTLAVAFLIGNQVAINLTLAVILANLIVSLIYLSVYKKYFAFVSSLINFFLLDEKRLLGLIGLMFVIPFLLLFIV